MFVSKCLGHRHMDTNTSLPHPVQLPVTLPHPLKDGSPDFGLGSGGLTVEEYEEDEAEQWCRISIPKMICGTVKKKAGHTLHGVAPMGPGPGERVGARLGK